MKKVIKPEDLPEILDEETIKILVEMCQEFPKKDFSWAEISELLLQRDQLHLILDIVQEKEEEKVELIKSQISEIEKLEEKQKMELLQKKIEKDPNYFYGNMGRPDTPEEYKSRFGVWPDGTTGDKYNPKK